MGNEWCDEPRKVKQEIKEYFQKRFFEEGSMEVVLEGVGFKSLSEDDNVLLVNSFFKKEIKEVVWSAMATGTLTRIN